MGWQAVAAGAPDLLVVALDAFGQVVMHHEAHIGLVDAHPEGDRRHDDLDIIPDEGFLVAAALIILQPGMVGADGIAFAGEGFAQFIHLPPGETVDDAGLILVTFQKAYGLDGGVALGCDFDIQVFPVEAGYELIRVGKVQGGFDVAAYARGGGGGQRQADRLRELPAYLHQLAVLGAEVVTPFGDAVGFIDGQAGDGDALQQVEQARGQQCFRGHVQQFDLAPAHVAHVFLVGFRRK